VIAVTAYAMKGDAQLAHDADATITCETLYREMLKLKFEKYLVTPMNRKKLYYTIVR
jgi:CheY-like chemotaxis protein